jgi:hypothetical protein
MFLLAQTPDESHFLLQHSPFDLHEPPGSVHGGTPPHVGGWPGIGE